MLPNPWPLIVALCAFLAIPIPSWVQPSQNAVFFGQNVTTPTAAFYVGTGTLSDWSACGNIVGSAATCLDQISGNAFGTAGQASLFTEWRQLAATTAGTGAMTSNTSTVFGIQFFNFE